MDEATLKIVEEELAKGVPEEKIREAMRQLGHPESEINEVLKRSESKNASSTPLRKIKIIAAIIIVGLAIGGFYFLYYEPMKQYEEANDMAMQLIEASYNTTKNSYDCATRILKTCKTQKTFISCDSFSVMRSYDEPGSTECLSLDVHQFTMDSLTVIHKNSEWFYNKAKDNPENALPLLIVQSFDLASSSVSLLSLIDIYQKTNSTDMQKYALETYPVAMEFLNTVTKEDLQKMLKNKTTSYARPGQKIPLNEALFDKATEFGYEHLQFVKSKIQTYYSERKYTQAAVYSISMILYGKNIYLNEPKYFEFFDENGEYVLE